MQIVTAKKRRLLWSDLINTSYNGSWMVAGDFNVVWSQEEKLGENSDNFTDVNDFNDMITRLSLLDGDFSGSKFTWSNNRLGRACILQRLDRALINSNWLVSFNTTINLLNRACSDHSHLLTRFATADTKGSCFRFLNT